MHAYLAVLKDSLEVYDVFSSAGIARVVRVDLLFVLQLQDRFDVPAEDPFRSCDKRRLSEYAHLTLTYSICTLISTCDL